MERRAILTRLEAALSRLASQGVGYLSIPRDEELGRLLRRAMEPEPPSPAPIRNTASPSPAPGRNTASPAPPPSRSAGSAKPPEPPSPAPGRPPGATGPPEPAGAAAPVKSPRPAGEHGTLESLLLNYRDCRGCELSQTRNRLVFGCGEPSPRLLFIGEGPGAEEDAQGLPFVGRAGALLTGLILALGLTRDDVYITNVVKCRPPGNRNPATDEMAACRPILDRQIELLDPALIVTLGNVPLKALKPSAGGITRERGRISPHGSWNLLPTFHPSYLLRNPPATKNCWQDFKLAFQYAYPESEAGRPA